MVLSENVAIGGSTAAVNARGGAVHGAGSGAAVTVVDSWVIGNTADDRPNATRGSGGGLSDDGGHLSVLNCTVAENYAFGGSPSISARDVPRAMDPNVCDLVISRGSSARTG